jgi:hypothetical protein
MVQLLHVTNTSYFSMHKTVTLTLSFIDSLREVQRNDVN